VEQASVSELFAHPMHPYTQGLFDSIPQIGSGKKRLVPIPGIVPSLNNLPEGCAFEDRCIKAKKNMQNPRSAVERSVNGSFLQVLAS
jgi:peptide/nickel transport system ATP-binding protein